MKISVFGGGSWGTALSVVLANKHHQVTLWTRNADHAATMQRTHHNPSYLSDIELPHSIQFTAELGAAARQSDLWLFVTPTQAIREVASQLASFTHPDLYVISASKGIENGTLKTTTEVLGECLPKIKSEHLGVLYGPSHAEEVIRGMPTTVLSASNSLETAQVVQLAFMSQMFRVYTHSDLRGVEIAGSVKNVMAIAAGISDGLGFGDNTKAAILTRGLAEIKRLGLAMGAQSETFSGLAGLGDLVVTCMSKHSRNRYVGEQIGRGKSLADIQAEMKMIAEGVKTTLSVQQLAAQFQVEMPITEAVHTILFDDQKPLEVIQHLMTRRAKNELEWLG